MRRLQKEIARRFDGADLGEAEVLATGQEARTYLEGLRELRRRAQLLPDTPQIADAQFPAFMDGVREGVDRATPGVWGHRIWAMLSLSAAALLVALSLFLVWNQAGPVSASVVEKATTEIQGATVNAYTSESGTAVVWVDSARVDLW